METKKFKRRTSPSGTRFEWAVAWRSGVIGASIPLKLMCDREIPPLAGYVWGVLYTTCEHRSLEDGQGEMVTYISHERIAKILKIHVGTVGDCVRRLEKRGWLKTVDRGPLTNKTTLYTRRRRSR